jgi:Synaptobrevin
MTARSQQLNKSCGGVLQRVCISYEKLEEVDKLAAVTKKVETVKLVMEENIQTALANCVKLESIEVAAEELQQQAGVFKRNANELRKKMWWQNMRMKLIIGFIILAIIGIIIGVAVAYSKANQSNTSAPARRLV